jgi:hypothetical protein
MVHFRSQQVGLTLANGRVILLDLEADRYFGLAAGPEAALRTQIESYPTASAGRRPSLIVGPRTFDAVEDTPPTTSLLDSRLPSTNGWSVALAAAVRALAARQLCDRPLCEILSRFAARKAALRDPMTAPQGDEFAILRIVAAFRASGRIVSGHNRCLSLSLALARSLVRRGFAVDLVIGVSGAPFGAHAWVQRGPLLLADELDRVRRFTPVMKI